MFFYKFIKCYKKSLLSIKRVLFIIFFLSCCTACHTPSLKEISPNSVHVPAGALEYDKYNEVLQNWTRRVKKYKDLELLFSGKAVLMSPQMIEVYKKRVRELRGEYAKADPIITSDGNLLVVVVEYFTNQKHLRDLSSQKYWSVELEYDESAFPPYAIYNYRDKEFMKAFFPFQSEWSQYFVLLFKLPVHQRDLFKDRKEKILLNLNSSEIQTRFAWLEE